jgi:ferredoxin
MKNITLVYFSPSGTTEKSAHIFGRALKESYGTIDLLRDDLKDEYIFGKDDLVLVAMPVFGGRIPALCTHQLKRLKAKGAYAGMMAVYGNRDYDDALIEMYDLLNDLGFKIVGAAATVAEHSIFHSVAKGRPDEADQKVIEDFAGKCLEQADKDLGLKVNFKGNRPYKKFGGVPFVPKGNQLCSNCGQCVTVCPVGAISKENPKATDKEKCIACTACIANCPTGARAFHTPGFGVAEKGFASMNGKRKESVFF